MRILFLALSAILLAACGTKGQLSLPPGAPTPPLLDRAFPPKQNTTPATAQTTPATDNNNKVSEEKK